MTDSFVVAFNIGILLRLAGLDVMNGNAAGGLGALGGTLLTQDVISGLGICGNTAVLRQFGGAHPLIVANDNAQVFAKTAWPILGVVVSIHKSLMLIRLGNWSFDGLC